ncbi:MAG: F-type H+-transporting ATPase subunit delta [Actinobacteria bacterium]|jgi:F-type H+-transporting ATPase subunit delta|nr:F-type H+-transporting ATPase subunit delta [Actinomycetota bacterium]
MRAHLGGSSRQSLVTARAALDAAVKGVDASKASTLSAELFFVADVLDTNIAVRRALTDSSRDDKSKSAFLTELFGSKIGALALGITTEISAMRWSAPKDLVLVIEQLAIEAEASAANIAGELDRVENEIFTASRAIAGSAELRKALTSDAKLAKATLVSEILKGASGSTVKLVSQLANTWRGRSIESAFDDYAHALAARRNRVIALVRVAAPLSAAQQERLSTALNNQVGQPVRINIEIEPAVIGGVSVKFADELVDGTVSNRLAGAARAVVGSK